MREIEDMLKELGNDEDLRKNESMSEKEKERIYERTMRKIAEEKQNSEKIDIGKQNSKNRNSEGNDTEKGALENQNTNNIISLDQELRHEKHKNYFSIFGKSISKAAVIGIAALLVGGTACAKMLHLDRAVRNYFHTNQKQESAVLNNVQQPNVKVKSGGVELGVPQTIGDNRSVYVVLKAKNVPKCLDSDGLSRKLEFQKTDISLENTSTVTWENPVLMDNGKNEKDSTKTFVVRINANKVNGKKITAQFSNLGYYTGKKKFHSLVNENWKLSWKLCYENDVVTKNVGKQVSYLDQSAKWSKLALSPLSVKIALKDVKYGERELGSDYEKYDGTDRIVVRFTDGTKIDSRFADSKPGEYGDDTLNIYDQSYVLSFGKIIDVAKVESVFFGNQKVVLKKKVTFEDRKEVISKAGNCRIAFPASFSDRIEKKEQAKEKEVEKGLKGRSVTFFITLKTGDKVPLFTIYRYRGMLSPKELYKKNPNCLYVGYRYDETYALQYSEVQDFSSEKAYKEYNAIMNDTISNILPYFEYLK